MNWLMESPITILASGAALEVLLLFALLNSGRKGFLWAMLAVLVVAAGLFGLERYIVTPGEEVRKKLDAIVAAVERDDVSYVLASVYSNAPATKEDIRRGFGHYQIREVSIKSNYQVVFDDRARPPEAEVRFNATATVRSSSGQIIQGERGTAVYLIMRFRKEEGDWKISEVIAYPPHASQTNQKIEPYQF